MSTVINTISPPKLRVNYAKIERDIGVIIARGAERLKAAWQRQTLETNWEVGRYLKHSLPLSDAPSPENARIIGRLSKKFNRPDGYFYSLIKFYRLYPRLPRDEGLSWSHYEVLLRIDDRAARGRYRRLALRKNISAARLYDLIKHDRARIAAGLDGPVLSAGGGRPVLPLKRGRLYHYKVTAPRTAAANTGTAELDVGFDIFREIPLSRASKLHAGHIVRTVKSEQPAVILGSETTKNLDSSPSGLRMTKLRDQFTVKVAKPEADRLYTYVAAVERVVDGDTPVLKIDLGLKTRTRQKLRLRGIDCPELSTRRGKYVKARVQTELARQAFVVVKTYWDDKYGRMLVDIFLPDGEQDPAAAAAKGRFLNQWLLDEGLATVWEGL